MGDDRADDPAPGARSRSAPMATINVYLRLSQHVLRTCWERLSARLVICGADRVDLGWMSVTRSYPSDLTDAQWGLIEAMVPAVRGGGRPAEHARRRIVEAILYVVRTGCSWRQLPHDFPPWPTVYWYFKQWPADGLVDRSMMRCVTGYATAQRGIRWPRRGSWMHSRSRARTPSAPPRVASTRVIMPGGLLCRVGSRDRRFSLVCWGDLVEQVGITTAPRGRRAGDQVAGSGACRRSGVLCGRGPAL